VNYPFIISLILHLTVCAVLGLVVEQHRPRVMTLPTQTIRWVNIAPAVVPSTGTTIPIESASPIPPTKPKVEKATTILPDKPPKVSETKSLSEEPIASSAAPPNLPSKPGITSQPTLIGIPGATGLMVEESDFTFVYYLNLIRNRIQEHWRPPYSSVDQPHSQQVMVAFKITRSGKITDIRIEQSSGNFLFDQAAQRALYEVATLPPLPEEYGGRELNVHIEFENLK